MVAVELTVARRITVSLSQSYDGLHPAVSSLCLALCRVPCATEARRSQVTVVRGQRPWVAMLVADDLLVSDQKSRAHGTCACRSQVVAWEFVMLLGGAARPGRTGRSRADRGRDGSRCRRPGRWPRERPPGPVTPKSHADGCRMSGPEALLAAGAPVSFVTGR